MPLTEEELTFRGPGGSKHRLVWKDDRWIEQEASNKNLRWLVIPETFSQAGIDHLLKIFGLDAQRNDLPFRVIETMTEEQLIEKARSFAAA